MRRKRKVPQARRLRQDSTVAERALWQFLRRDRLGWPFRRQADLGPYIIDFLSFDPPIAVEIDGPLHELPENVERDARKDAYLREHGFLVLRFEEKRARMYPDLVVAEIKAAGEQLRGASPSPNPSPATRGEGL